MPITNVSTQAPTDYGIQAQEIERRRKLAEALQTQSMRPLETNQMAGGYVLPTSPTQGLAKMLQAYAGAQGQKNATEQQMALAQAMRGERQQTIEQAMAAMQGTPATAGSPSPSDELGGGPAQPAQAAVAGDAGKGYSILAGSQDPALSQYGATAGFEEASRKRKLAEMMGAFGLNGGGAQSGQTSAPGAVPPGAAKDDIGGIPRSVAMALLLTDPSGKTLAAAQAKAAASAGTPINVRPGGTVYVPGQGPQFTAPQGSMQTTWKGGQPQVGTVPGALPAMGAQAQATAAGTQAGQAPYQPSVVNTEGAPSLMTRQQQIEAATGRPMPQPGQPIPTQAVVGPNPQANQVQQNLAAIDAEMAKPGQTPANIATLKAERENILRQAGQPPGLRLQDQGASSEQVKGGQERAQLTYDAPIARRAVADASANLDRLETEARKIYNDPAISKITGMMGVFPNMPGGSAADVQAKLGALKSQVGFAVLQSMREASKTGGALGAISDKENELLQRNLAALDQSQSPEAFKKNLQQIMDYAKGARDRLGNSYRDQYERVLGNQGMQPGPQGAQPTQQQIIPGQGMNAQAGGQQVVRVKF